MNKNLGLKKNQKLRRKLIYSQSAAERITGKKVSKVQIFPRFYTGLYRDYVGVYFLDGKAEAINKGQFLQEFSEWRKRNGALLVKANPLGIHRVNDRAFMVQSENDPDRHYFINLHINGLQCSCADWANQKEIGISNPCCKHCYAVMFQLGYKDLKDYQDIQGLIAEQELEEEMTAS